MAENVRKCETCEFVFKPTDFVACHRYPPRAELSMVGAFIWPSVKLTDWCGEYKPKK